MAETGDVMTALRLLVRSGKPAQLGAGHAAVLLAELERLRARVAELEPIERRARSLAEGDDASSVIPRYILTGEIVR